MYNEITYILTGCAILVTLYVFILTNPPRKTSRKSKIAKTPRPGVEPALFNAFTLKLDEFFKRIDSIEIRNLRALRETTDLLKKNLADFNAEAGLKLKSNEEAKNMLRSLLSKINGKIDEVLKRFENEEKNLENERRATEQKMKELSDESAEKHKENQTEITKLAGRINMIKEENNNLNIEQLKKEIEPIMNEALTLSAKYGAYNTGVAGVLQEKDLILKTSSSSAAESIGAAEKEKIKRVSEIRARMKSLESTVNDLRRTVSTEQEKHKAHMEKSANEIAAAREYISRMEEDRKTAEKLISEREELQEKLVEIREGQKIQEERFGKEIAARDAEIEKINTMSLQRIKELEDSVKEEELKFESERKPLEEEVQRLKNQIEANAAAGGKNLEKLQAELRTLEESCRKKEIEYSDLNKKRVENEIKIKEELIRRLNEFKKNVEGNIKKFNSGIKLRDDEIYSLKVRLSAREDKLRTDMMKRKETGSALLEDLRNTSEQLRSTYSKESDEINVRIKPVFEHIETVRQTLASLENAISQEQVIFSKLESERKRIESEIEIIQKKLGEDTADAKKLIELKNRYVARLSEEIIEKERLFTLERKVRHQIIQGRYLVKKG